LIFRCSHFETKNFFEDYFLDQAPVRKKSIFVDIKKYSLRHFAPWFLALMEHDHQLTLETGLRKQDPYTRHRALFLYGPTVEMSGAYTCKVSTLNNEVLQDVKEYMYRCEPQLLCLSLYI
jgi:hypothetical protein